MAIDLVKGQHVDIGLRRVVVGLGWAPNSLALDLSAFMLNDKRKFPLDRYFIYFGNIESPDGAVLYASDDNDDESMTVVLDKVSPDVTEILFAVAIYDAHLTGENFGQVRHSYIRIYDAANPSNVLCEYEPAEDFSEASCVEFGRLYKRDDVWCFEAVGAGYRHNNQQPLQALVEKYV